MLNNPPPARLAGALWLAVIALGFFALFAVRAELIVKDDPAATAARILGSETLFRAGVIADYVGGLIYLALTAILYQLFKPVSRSLAFASALFGAGGVFVSAAVSALYAAPLVFLKNQALTSALDAHAREALSYAFVALNGIGYNFCFLIFGLHLITLGWLMVGSRFVPVFFGILLMAGGAAYFATSAASFLAPAWYKTLPPLIGLAGGVAEVVTALWLALAGVDAARWRERLQFSREGR